MRAAIQQANSSASNDVITFAAGLQTITLTLETEISISNNGTLQINGTGANVLTISGGAGLNRIFNTDNATVVIADMTLTDSGQDSFGGTGTTRNGGAILVNGGALTLQRANIKGNFAGNTSIIGDSGAGGGIYFVGGSDTIQNSTVSNNYAQGVGGIGIEFGNVNVTIINSTISNNTGTFQGGGVFNAGNLILRNTTIANNFCNKPSGISNLGYGGGVANINGTLQMINTIIAGNEVQNTTSQTSVPEIYFSSGTITSNGNNLIGDSANDSVNTGQPIAYQPTDIRDVNPQLGALGNYGGTTPTKALLPNSPAINAANNTNAPPTDQRGASRVGTADIGAYEFDALTFSISGRVSDGGNLGLSGETVTLSGSSSATTTTNANGEYSFTGLVEGSNYTVTPSLANYTFSPLSTSFKGLYGNQTANFRPDCSYSINPTSAVAPTAGSSGSVAVTTVGFGCGWTATSNVSWITVTSGASGKGNGTANYTVASNPGPNRTGTITIAGQTFTVTRAALPALSINNVTLLEGNSGTTAFTFTVTLSGTFTQSVTVNYSTINATATTPTDYQATSGTLTFALGETSKTITVLVNGDKTAEPIEIFTVNLSGATNASIANPQGIGTIQNDDQVLYDFDGDGKADIAVFRPSNGFWYLLNSQTGFTAVQYGQAGDQIVPADYDGDGKTDVAVFRNGIWFLRRSTSGDAAISWGTGSANAIPQPGDYTGDGKADPAFYSPSNATLYVYNIATGAQTAFNIGQSGDIPVAADYDGDGKTDPAVFRNGVWIIRRSTLGNTTVQFGQAGDKAVPADYDGDGKMDIAVFRPSNGTWYLQQSTAGFTGFQFGISTDLPTPADYDGDGKADIAVYRDNTWYIQGSTSGFTGAQFGSTGDKPVPNAYIP